MKKIKPAPGQESVWDYPRPPRLERTAKHIQVFFNGTAVADTRGAWRVLETSHPPVYYIPRRDITEGLLLPASGSSLCEWKGQASYYDVAVDGVVARAAAWSYRNPTKAFAPITDHVAFYAGRMSRCLVDGELVTPQPGDFYGGWITSDIVGPFKQ